MPQKMDALPTPEELKFYRSKAVSGAHIGRRQLSKVFAALDAALARAERAEARIKELER